MTRHVDDGDDLVQSTVERALSRFGSWSPLYGRLDSWLFKIMQNIWFDQLRARRRRGDEAPVFDLGDLAGGDDRATIEVRNVLRTTLEAILRLPEEQRIVVTLVLVEGFSYREAAQITGVPIGTVMSRLARARTALDDLVFGENDEPQTWLIQ